MTRQTAFRSLNMVTWLAALALGSATLGVRPAQAQPMRPDQAPPEIDGVGPLRRTNNSTVTLTDRAGRALRFGPAGDIYSDDEGVLSGGNRLTINQQQLQASRGMWTTADDQTLVMALQFRGPVRVTRVISASKDLPVFRVVEWIENTTDTPQEVAVQVYHGTNYSIQGMQGGAAQPEAGSATMRHAVVRAGPPGRPLLGLVVSGSKAPVEADIRAENNSTSIAVTWARVSVPANGRVALVHLVGKVATDAEITQLNERVVLRSLPGSIRRQVVNFRRQIWTVDDDEVLRGENDDVATLANGVQLHGTLEPVKLTIATSVGDVTVPTEDLAALIPQPGGRARVVLKDGQVLIGRLGADRIALTLNTGQKVELPLARVSQVGTRSSDEDPERWQDMPRALQLRDGQRLNGDVQPSDVQMVTRYGTFTFPAAEVAGVRLRPDEAVHRVELRNGSVLLGIIPAGPVKVRFDLVGEKTIGRDALLEINAKLPRSAPATAPAGGRIEVLTASGEKLVGAVSPAKLALQTEFGDLAADLAYCGKVEFAAGRAPGAAQVQFQDGTSAAGRVTDEELAIAVGGAVTIKVPVAMLTMVVNPAPALPPATLEKVRKLVADLDHPELSRRERAQEQLAEMGARIALELKTNLPEASPEARARLEKVLEQIAPAGRQPGAGDPNAAAGNNS